MKRKINMIALVVIFFAQTLFSSIAYPAKAQAAGNQITENLITSVELKDKKDQVINAEENPDLHPKLGDEVEVFYTWALKNNHGYKAGDQFSFNLPAELTLYNDIDPQPLVFGGITVGTFTVTMAGKVTMTFNGEIETHSNISGTIDIWSKFSEKLVGSVTKEIVFPVQDGKTVEIPVIFQPNSKNDIDKQGDPNKLYNADEIEWTVDFNKNLAKVDDAILEDPLQAGQTLKPGSIKLYYLDMQLDGTAKLGAAVDPSEYKIEKTANGSDFQIHFTAKTIRSAYRLVYTTNVDMDQTKFTNEAKLLGKNLTPLKASATVTITRGLPLAKTATNYFPKTQTIEWTIKYNYNEKTVAQKDALLTDYFNDIQTLDLTSFKVFEVTLNANGTEKSSQLIDPSNYTVTPKTKAGQNGFELQFLNPINTAYKIVYLTKAKDRVFDDSTTITNTVEYGTTKVPATKPINQGIIVKTNNSSFPNTDYNKKITTWNITFNDDEYTMNNVTLTDIFPNKGLTLLPDTLVIQKDVNGKKVTLTKDVDYVLTQTSQDQFILTFKNQIKETHYISYQTKFDYEARDVAGNKYLDNKATLNWKDDKGVEQTKTATAKFTPDGYTQNSGFKNGSYNAVTKEITWNVGINYNLKTIAKPIVEDYFLQGQELVPGSLKLYEMNLTGQGNGTSLGKELQLDTDYTVATVTDSKGNPGVRIAFKKQIDSPYFLTYKTSLKDKLIDAKYNNTATIYDDTKEVDKLTASVSVTNGGKYVTKTGAQNNKVVDWNVEINFGQSQLTNAKLIDDPSINQIILEDSFHVYGTKVAVNGTVTKNPAVELKRDVDYKVDITTDDQGKQSFTLEFLHPIDTAYILNYQSFINARNGDTLTNNIKLKGEQITTEETESSGSVKVGISGGSGTGSGETGGLEVTKVDAASGEVLKGATFTLYDSEGKIAIRTLTTGDDGKVTFTNLLYNDYLLKEATAPDGYVVGINDSQKVTVNDKPTKVTIQNKKIIRAVELTKLDSDNPAETLKGAKFALLFKVGSEYTKIAELETNMDGKIYQDQLEPGDYQLVEIVAPFGYILDATPLSFKITEKQTEKISLTMKNELSPGSVELVKVDKDHPEVTLSGAVFDLQNKNGKTVQSGLTTDKDGKLVVPNLKPGDYQFVETKAPFGYDLDAKPIPFTIVKGQVVAAQVTAINELTTSSVELTKVDKENSDWTLTGAEFELQTDSGKTLKSGLVTDADGKIVVPDLKPGSYQFVETKAPFGYDLDQTPIPFTIVKGPAKVVKVTASNALTLGSVALTKVDKDHPEELLTGAEFELQTAAGRTVKTELVSDENGKIIVDNLKPGNYQFVETKAPFGYVLDTTPIPFTIVKGPTEVVQITATNELTTGAVELTKLDKDGPKGATLAGVEFALQDADGNTLKSGLLTNADGKLFIDNLKPGIYQFVETKALFGYDLDETPLRFTIVKGQVETTSVTATNELTTGSVELTKFDKDHPEVVVAGAEFTLADADGKALQEGLVTDEDGKLVVDSLKPGDYQFIETKAPFGYELDATPIKFTIVKGPTEVVKVTATNELTTGTVELTKVDKDDPKAVLAGAEFTLADADGNVLQKGLVTGGDGKLVVDNLKPGDYQFIETKAPFGYELDATPIKFTIEKGQIISAKVTAVNELTTGAVELTKVDKDDHDVTLAGAEFTLQDAAGNALQTGLVTDANGKIVVDSLKPDNYQFVETKAPTGYKLDGTPITFTIAKGQTEKVKVLATNAKQPEVTPTNPDKPATKPGTKHPLADTATNIYNWMLAGAGLLLAGIVLLIVNRRRKVVE